MEIFSRFNKFMNKILPPADSLSINKKNGSDISTSEKLSDTLNNISESNIKKTRSPRKKKVLTENINCDLSLPEKTKVRRKKTNYSVTTEEPWIKVLSFDIDKNSPKLGSFELDWNPAFVTQLMSEGYQGKTPEDVVENWFRDICKNIYLESLEQEIANHPEERVTRKNLGNGRSEIS